MTQIRTNLFWRFMAKNLKFFLNVGFESSKEASWHTDRKYSQVQFLKNQEKPLKMQIYPKLARFGDISVFFLDFLSNGTWQRLVVFGVAFHLLRTTAHLPRPRLNCRETRRHFTLWPVLQSLAGSLHCTALHCSPRSWHTFSHTWVSFFAEHRRRPSFIVNINFI